MSRASAQHHEPAEGQLPPSVRVLPGFLAAPEAARLLRRCEAELSFAAHPVRVFGRTTTTPRQTAFLAPAGVRYRYSGHVHEGAGLPAWLEALRADVSEQASSRFVSVLVTRYRSGRDRVGWHADDERELGPDPVIAVLSLGSARDLCFRPATAAARDRWRVPLASGDLLIMESGAQRDLRHALPPRSGAGVRVSLSFRPAAGEPA